MIRKMLAGLVMLLLGSGPSAAEPMGGSEVLPATRGAHWFWIADFLLGRTALIDADSGAFLGMISAGLGVIAPNFSSDGRHIYLPETHYARGTRGERTDIVTIYDARTLSPTGEIGIPPKRADLVTWMATSTLSDDDRFLAIFNLTPATSLSIVDLEARSFVGEISTPGCSLVFAAGERRFAMICADGAVLTVTLDEDGAELARERSEPFFDPEADPVTEKAVRYRDQWLFVSFEGFVHPMDVSGEALGFGEPWSLLSDADRQEGWRIGGAQHLAVHEPTRRLYSVVHQGEPDTHKDPGPEIWVYDVETRARLQRIETRNPTIALTRQMLDLEEGGFLSGVVGWLVGATSDHPGVGRVVVTQDDEPVLITTSGFPASVSVYDALTGEWLRDLEETGFTASFLHLENP